MHDQTAKLKCWNCKDIFHIRIKSDEGRSFSQVAVIKPCPYCEAQCRVVLPEGQVPGMYMMKGVNAGNDGAWFEKLSPGALTETVFESEAIEEDE